MIRFGLFYLLAAVVPTFALWLAAPASRSAHGMAVSPFGWMSLLIVHCLAAVPMAAMIASGVKFRAPIPAVVMGLIFAAIGYFTVSAVAESLDSAVANFNTRCATRSFICLLLALPWALAARTDSPKAPVSLGMLAVGLVVAFVLPGVWASKLAKENKTVAQEELAAMRLARSLRFIDGVCDIDPACVFDEEQGNLTMPAARERLTRDLKRLADDLDRVDVRTLKPTDRLRHANALISLDRPADAEPILRELARTQPPVNLPLARSLHLMGQYDESDSALRELLTFGLPDLKKNPKIDKACLDAYDLLAENATKRGSNSDREAVLREGLAKMPDSEAYFRFQLGRHYKLSGQPFNAVRELNEAAKLDQRYESMAAPLLRELRELTPACLIGR